ncbi:MAG: class I SAM-dependent methyltransferase [Nitrospinota bacterium]
MIYQRQRKFFEEAYKTGEHGWPTEGPSRSVVRFLKYIKRGMPRGKVLDIGCGEGRHTIFFAENGFDAYGIDMEPLAIGRANKFARAKGVKRHTHFIVADALNLPFLKSNFNIAIDYGCLHHIKKSDWKTYIENIKMILKEDAFFILSVFTTKFKHYEGDKRKRKWIIHKNHYDHFFTKGDLKQLFRKPFKVLKIEEEKNGLHVFYHCLMHVKKP